MRRRNNSHGVGNEGKSMSANPETVTTPMPASSVCDQSSSNNLRLYRILFVLHSALVLGVLIIGMLYNGGNRKYIPVNQRELFKLLSASGEIEGDGLSESGPCRKAYINVHSTAITENLAAICCSGSDNGNSTLDSNEGRYQSNLCDPRIPVLGVSMQQLPFARRLTRISVAWVLPLLPVLIRLIYQSVMVMHSSFTQKWKCQNQGDAMTHQEAISLNSIQESSASSPSCDKSSVLFDKCSTGTSSIATARPSIESNHGEIRATIHRLLFYFFIILFRGFVLFLGANAVEDNVILPWVNGGTASMSDAKNNLNYSSNEPDCWYKQLLKSHHRSAMEKDGHTDCYGRPFDFSDHVVLFLAHYLPIVVMETLHCYSFPFWGPLAVRKTTNQLWPSYFLSGGIIWTALYMILFLYLHLIVLHATYLTAAYFHTPAEIIVGYLVSLIIQLPVAYLLCSRAENWYKLKRYIGLPLLSEEGGGCEKGD